jgi:EmrB/QacA subfamily drug resistance transporter
MYVILSAIVIGIAMVFIDSSVLPIALPSIQQDLHASSAQMRWTIDGYFLTVAVFMLAGGKLVDLFGQRFMFAIGVSVFGIASLLCGLSPNPTCLILSRFIQGIGGSLLLPPCIPILLAAFPEDKKGFAIGLQTAFSSFFLIVGPLVGGFLTEYFTWRSVFFINIPLAVLALFLTFLFVPKSCKTKRQFDWLGFASYSIGIICLTVAIIQVQSWGWMAFSTFIFIALGVVFLFFLYLSDKHAKEPFVNFTLFHHRTFKEAGLSIFTSAFQLMITVFLPIYFQKILLFSPAEAGFYMAISSLPMMIGAPLAGKLLDRYGYKVPILIGQSLTIFSFLWMMIFLPLNQFALILPALFLLSMGFTSIMAPSFSAGVSCIPPENRGIASGMLGTIRSLGSNFGVAAMGTLIADTQSHLLFKKMGADEQTASLSYGFIDGLLHSTKPAIDALQHLSTDVQQLVTLYLNESYQYGFGLANAVSAGMGLIGMFGVFVWFKKSRINDQKQF